MSLFVGNKIQMRRSVLPTYSKNRTCYNVDRRRPYVYYYLREVCNQKCKEECYQAYYLLENKQTRTLNKHTYPIYPAVFSLVVVSLEPSSMPNVIVNHLPEMTFLSVFCSFGGLMGMWLGVSILATIDNLLRIIKIAYYKIVSVNFNLNLGKQKNHYKYSRIYNINRIFVINSNNRIKY